MIPYSRQDISESDIDEVKKILRSKFLTQGPTVPKFEQTVTDYCNVSYGVAANSATSALHIACLALDLQPETGYGRLQTLMFLVQTVDDIVVQILILLILIQKLTICQL